MNTDDASTTDSTGDWPGDETGEPAPDHDRRGAGGGVAGEDQPDNQAPPLPRKPRYPLTGVEVAPLAVVVAGVVAGMIIVILGQWRLGCLVIGAILGVGCMERLLLPAARVGLLQARSRLLDTLTLLGMAVGICVLAIVVPGA